MVREHQFLAAPGNIQYDYGFNKGFSNAMFGGGFFVEEFMAADHEGVVRVHGYGNVFEKTLQAGEVIDIEPGGWSTATTIRLALERPISVHTLAAVDRGVDRRGDVAGARRQGPDAAAAPRRGDI